MALFKILLINFYFIFKHFFLSITSDLVKIFHLVPHLFKIPFFKQALDIIKSCGDIRIIDHTLTNWFHMDINFNYVEECIRKYLVLIKLDKIGLIDLSR